MLAFFDERKQAGKDCLNVANKLLLSRNVLVDFGRVDVDVKDSCVCGENFGVADYAVRKA